MNTQKYWREMKIIFWSWFPWVWLGMAGLDCTLTTLGGAVPATLSWEREGVALSARQRPGLSTEVVIYFATFFFVIHTFRYVRYSSIRILSPGILLMSILYMYCTVLSGKSLFYCNSLLKLHITNISLYRSVDRVIASNLHQRWTKIIFIFSMETERLGGRSRARLFFDAVRQTDSGKYSCVTELADTESVHLVVGKGTTVLSLSTWWWEKVLHFLVCPPGGGKRYYIS